MISSYNSSRAAIAALTLYAILYGFFMINWVDLVGVAKDPFHVYHLWLIGMYFAPWLVVLLLYGRKDWEIFLALGLLTSLMNDLFYYPAAYLMFFEPSQLASFYRYQLGFLGNEPSWTFEGGFLQFKVTSYIMAASIYGRLAAATLLFAHWWEN